MKRSILQLAAICSLAFTLNSSAAVFYVDVNGTNPVSPYTSWATAATNIQNAVFRAGSGDTVLITNGIYQCGGYSLAGSNRVYVLNNITVQSVNGPAVTMIKGAWDAATNGPNAVRCAYLNNGATLSGFTLTNGATQNYGSGGGVCCQSTNCLVTNCVITGNTAYNQGGGACYGTLVNCALIGNSAAPLNNDIGNGGGAYESTLVNCVLTRNFAGYVSGAAGFCTLINCTLVSNSVAGYSSGSVEGCTLKNCIVYYNFSDYTNTDAGGSGYYTNCCLSFAATFAGANNFTNPPAFVNLAGGDFHLQLGSPCINAGNNSFITDSTDLDGNPRIIGGTVDMGAYENQYTGTVHYVSLNSTNPVTPYTNWSTAATNIQDAVSAAQNGEIVVASSGTYNSGSTIIYGQEANRVALTNAITLLGLYGPQSTMIVGGTQTRCVYVGGNAVLNGFTLSNGGTRSTGDLINEQSGGDAWCETGGVVSNCVFGGNGSRVSQGGGIYGGTVYNSTLANNKASYGGAAAAASLFNCVVVSNSVYGFGGGIIQGTAFNCTFTGNSAFSVMGSGGGGDSSTFYNCTLENNSGAFGGGVIGGTLYDCILSSNTASSSGGGAYQSKLYNCTVLGNTANSGGGVYESTLYNSIVYYNSAPNGSNYGGGTLNYLNYCDTTPLVSGLGNITNEPAFVNLAAGDFHLQTNSPCINSGNNAYVSTTNDLDGNPRISGGTVDIGVYEFQNPASVISYAWLQQYGLPTDGSADNIDSDGDGMNNYQEWMAGTDPTNPLSVLKMLTPASTNNPSGLVVSWQSVNTRTYYLQRSTDLGAQPAFSTIQTDIAGQAGTTSYTDTDATGNGPYFYRVGVQQ